jgi:hypothetical protein
MEDGFTVGDWYLPYKMLKFAQPDLKPRQYLDAMLHGPVCNRLAFRPVFLGRNWHIVRECPTGQAPGGVQHYFGGMPGPLQLDEADALALAEMLNRA